MNRGVVKSSQVKSSQVSGVVKGVQVKSSQVKSTGVLTIDMNLDHLEAKRVSVWTGFNKKAPLRLTAYSAADDRAH